MTIKKKALYNLLEPKNEADWLKMRALYLTASDTASAIGISRWKTPLELWGEKTGLRQPKDLSNNEYVLRGKEREPIIRDSFAKNNDWLMVSYNQYGIYVSTREGYGMLGATLDGSLEVIADNDWGIPIGFRGVLEIKTVTVSEHNMDVVNGWLNRSIPEHYLAQVHQQIFCTDSEFAIVQAELDYGEEAEERFVLAPPIVIDASTEFFAIKETVNKAREFWRSVETKTPPTTYVEADTSAGMEIVPLVADTEVGSFYQNFDLVKASIERIVEPYRGIEFTEDQQKEAKEIKANLNKMVKDIDAKRLMVKKKYLEPLSYFESKANELKEVIVSVINPISEQIDEFENNRLAEKDDLIESLIAELILTDMPDDVGRFYIASGSTRKDKRWFNKSVKEAEIRKEILEQIREFTEGYQSIISMTGEDSELRAMMLSEFSRTQSLAESIKARDRIISAREESKRIEEEQKARAEELRAKMKAKMQADEEAKRQKAKPAPEPAEEPVPVPPAEAKPEPAERMISFTFKASHKSKKAWVALIDYMKTNGFYYERVQ